MYGDNGIWRRVVPTAALESANKPPRPEPGGSRWSFRGMSRPGLRAGRRRGFESPIRLSAPPARSSPARSPEGQQHRRGQPPADLAQVAQMPDHQQDRVPDRRRDRAASVHHRVAGSVAHRDGAGFLVRRLVREARGGRARIDPVIGIEVGREGGFKHPLAERTPVPAVRAVIGRSRKRASRPGNDVLVGCVRSACPEVRQASAERLRRSPALNDHHAPCPDPARSAKLDTRDGRTLNDRRGLRAARAMD